MSPVLEPIGRVENVDREPVIIPIVGYLLESDPVEEIIQELRFLPVQPTGASLDLFDTMTPDGAIATPDLMTFLKGCLWPGDEEIWEEFLYRKDVMIERGTLIEVYKRLTEWYAARPTQQRSGSSDGSSTPKRTSRGAASGRVTAKKTSPSS